MLYYVMLHPISVRRFPSFRTQPLKSLSVDSVKKSLGRPIKIRLRASQPLGHPGKSYRT